MSALFYMGRVTNGAGKELPEKAFLTFGSPHGQDNGDCDVEIKGKRAHEAALLIFAAPDMLAALKELEEFLDNQADADGGRPNDAMRLLNEVRNAIAKTEGPTP